MDKRESSRQMSAEHLLSLMEARPDSTLHLDSIRSLLKKIPQEYREKIEGIFQKFIFSEKSFEMAGSSFITMYKQTTVKQITRRLTPQEKHYALSRIRDFMEEPTETDHNLSDLIIREYTPIYNTFQSHNINTTKIIKTNQTEQLKHRRNHSDDKGITKSFDYSHSRHLRRSSDIGCWNFSDVQDINKIKQLHINKNNIQLTSKYRRSNENLDPRYSLQPEAPTRNSRKGTRVYKNIINCN